MGDEIDATPPAADADHDSQKDERSAGKDRSIRERLKRHPEDPDAKLDEGLDESMDASDPPAVTGPATSEPAPSSGYDEEAERRR